MTLASDQYDPDTGLDHSGDAGLHVQFYDKKVIDPANPEIGRLKDVERMEAYCRIIVPGNKDHIHDQPARDCDKQRFPRHWMAFQMQNNEQGAAGFGTSLEQWVIDEPGVINENQRIELFQLRFQTVEQVAMATDAQIQRMPLGASGMRENARRYLKNKSRGDADGEVTAMKAQMAEMAAMIEKLSNPKQVVMRQALATVAPIDPETPYTREPVAVRKTRGPNKVKRATAVRSRRGIDAATTGDASHG